MWLTTLKTPMGLGECGAPTAISKVRRTRSFSRTASLRSGMLTMTRRAGRFAFSCAIASAAAISITPVSVASVFICSSIWLSIWFLLTERRDAGMGPGAKLLIQLDLFDRGRVFGLTRVERDTQIGSKPGFRVHNRNVRLEGYVLLTVKDLLTEFCTYLLRRDARQAQLPQSKNGTRVDGSHGENLQVLVFRANIFLVSLNRPPDRRAALARAGR